MKWLAYDAVNLPIDNNDVDAYLYCPIPDNYYEYREFIRSVMDGCVIID
jgi:hypothetical protein